MVLGFVNSRQALYLLSYNPPPRPTLIHSPLFNDLKLHGYIQLSTAG